MPIWVVDYKMVNGRKGFCLVEGMDEESVRRSMENRQGSVKVLRMREWR